MTCHCHKAHAGLPDALPEQGAMPNRRFGSFRYAE